MKMNNIAKVNRHNSRERRPSATGVSKGLAVWSTPETPAVTWGLECAFYIQNGGKRLGIVSLLRRGRWVSYMRFDPTKTHVM